MIWCSGDNIPFQSDQSLDLRLMEIAGRLAALMTDIRIGRKSRSSVVQ